jgi:hypothetical protein
VRRQDLGRIAGPAAEVDRRTRFDFRQRRQQIAHRPGPFRLEGHVLFGGPAHAADVT